MRRAGGGGAQSYFQGMAVGLGAWRLEAVDGGVWCPGGRCRQLRWGGGVRGVVEQGICSQAVVVGLLTLESGSGQARAA